MADEHAPQYEEKTGLVAMLGVVGGRVQDMEAARRLASGVEQIALRTGVFLGADEGTIAIEPELRIMGDRLLLVWAGEQLGMTLQWASRSLAALVGQGLVEKLPLRGAVAYGEFAVSRHAILGPAITDAAEWYEEADFIGVIATPRCEMLIESVAERGTASGRAARHWVSYDAPLRTGDRRPTWVVAWPDYFCFTSVARHLDLRGRLTKLLSEYHIPRSATTEFTHTVEFLDYYLAHLGTYA